MRDRTEGSELRATALSGIQSPQSREIRRNSDGAGWIWSYLGAKVDQIERIVAPKQESLQAFYAFSDRVRSRRLGFILRHRISYRAQSAKRATTVVNSIASAYAAYRLRGALAREQRRGVYLEGRLIALQKQIMAAEAGMRFGTVPENPMADSGVRCSDPPDFHSAAFIRSCCRYSPGCPSRWDHGAPHCLDAVCRAGGECISSVKLPLSPSTCEKRMMTYPWTRCWTVVAVLLATVGIARAAEPYKLGPQDQLQVKVSDLRAGTGEAYQWQAFNGDFTVAASGNVSLPIVGEIAASGRTTTEIAADIADNLKTKAGLAAKPDASVQIIKYRPYYVMGGVEKPGEYEFRPQMSVLQAVSMAGGLQRFPPTSFCSSCATQCRPGATFRNTQRLASRSWHGRRASTPRSRRNLWFFRRRSKLARKSRK